MRYGTFKEEELIDLAVANGLQTIVLTDINNTSACLNFVRLLEGKSQKPVIGIDFRRDHQALYVAIAKNNAGFQEMNSHLSFHLENKIPIPDQAPEFENSFVIYPLKKVMEMKKIRFRESEFIGISIAALRKLPFTDYIKLKDKLVVLQTVSFRNKRDFNAHRLLRCIDLNILLSQLPEDQQGSIQDQMIPLVNLEKVFEEYPYILKNTTQLLEECSICFDYDKSLLNANQKTYHRDRANNVAADLELLKQLAQEGIPYRYEQSTPDIVQRIEKEITTVARKGFVAYFLINWEICKYARDKGYFYVGRGSGANSILAYLLQITEVDPIELDLYFERFINDYRSSPPDFDLDFSWDDREDVTRFIFDRFDNVALLATYNTFQYRAVIRELGKVFGLPKADIDQLSTGDLRHSKLDQMHRLVLKYAHHIKDKPNYTSIHAGGILITERPLHYYSATSLPPKGFPTVQFDMHIAEDAGIHKFDILAQRGLGKIRDAIQIIKKNQPEAQVADVRRDTKKFMKDASINAMISQAKCIGCFYVESPAMRMLLSKLATDDYIGLVAASSVIRPGVAQSGMMREFILRTRYPEKRAEAHPIMQSIMPETYGIMVYQEDVIKVAHYYAKLDLGEADILRRGMSGKYRSREEFQKVEQKYYQNCLDQGYDPAESQEIWNQIKSFAGYAFAKGHSASYAVESYQSLYLKRYFPLEYMTATLNNGGGFYRPELYVHEAKMCGATIEAPCINHSDIANTIEGTTIYLGYSYLKELEHKTMKHIVEARWRDGAFQSLEDFINRVLISVDQISILIRINAFRFTGMDRYELLWQALFKMDKNPKKVIQKQLFVPKYKESHIPRLTTTQQELAFEQIELLGFPLCSHFDLLASPTRNNKTRKDLKAHLNSMILIYGYVINIKTTHTGKGMRMQFGTFIDRDGHFFDTVMFPSVAARITFRGSGIYAVYGKVVEEFYFYSIEVQNMEKADYIQDPRYAEDNPQTMQRLDKQASLRERRMGNGNGYRRQELPHEKVEIHQPGGSRKPGKVRE
ncbi:error-prone repair homolog of DNA polymerase III alpha subunit [Nonlabens marinus S1-08]|uniref:DNA polymerase III subunit alpha n=2 Tax=Nonlabens TaxID=363408 RepID=W8VPI2_9FLAO|nr:error-prone repair homolog of DNA polymerase III alpha subunit [Nonlabens marinus S1-08]